MDKQITGAKPKVLITDGLQSYHDAYQRKWRIRNRQELPAISFHLRGNMNNNKMEVMNGEFHDRKKIMRSRLRTLLIHGYLMYPTTLDRNMVLNGQIPRGFAVRMEGNNKCMMLIQNANRK